MKKLITNTEVLKIHKATGIWTVKIKKNIGMVDIKKVLEEAGANYGNIKNKTSPEAKKALEKWNSLSIKLIKESLNFEEALFILNSDFIYSGKNSEPWSLAEKRLTYFGLKNLKDKHTIKDVYDFWRDLDCRCHGKTELTKKVINKWNKLVYADLKIADTAEKVIEIWRNSYNPSKAHDTVEKKLDKLVSALVKKAQTLSETLYAYKFALYYNDTKKRAIEKILTFISDFHNAKKVFDEAKIDGAFYKCLEFGDISDLTRFYSGFHKYKNGGLERELAKKIESLSLEEASKATEVTIVRDLYYAVSNVHYSEDTVKTLKEKWEELALKEASNIKNPDEFKKVYEICPDDDNSQARKVALEKMLTF